MGNYVKLAGKKSVSYGITKLMNDVDGCEYVNMRSGITNVWRTPVDVSFTFLLVTYYGNFCPISSRIVQTPSCVFQFTLVNLILNRVKLLYKMYGSTCNCAYFGNTLFFTFLVLQL